MDANELLMGGGGVSAKFPTLGCVVQGYIVAPPKSQQQRDLDTGEVKTFSNGDPMWQIVVQLQTDTRDPDIADDDGIRNLYIKGQMFTAVREAVRKTGAKGLDVGGHLAVQWASEGEAKKRGFNPPKVYRALYTPADPFVQPNEIVMGPPVATPPPAAPLPPLPPLAPPTVSSEQRQTVLDQLRRSQQSSPIFAGTDPQSEEVPF